jgi:histidinol-phosphate aminotransferase
MRTGACVPRPSREDSAAKLARFARREWLIGAGGVAALSLGAARAAAAPTTTTQSATAQSAAKSADVSGLRVRVNVALNESPYGPSPHVAEALRSNVDRLERYVSGEASALTRQIAQVERVPEQHVVLGEILEPLGLHLGLSGGPGGEFLYSTPGYTTLVDASQPVGGVGVGVPLNDRLENDLAGYRSKVNARTRAAFLVNPHNPSGTMSESQGFKSFVSELARQTLVVVDEAYLEYSENFAARTLADRVRAGENVMVFRTFSKIHGLAGLPFGYALAPVALAEALRKRGVGNPRSLNRLAVLAAAASLSDPEHVAKVRSKVSLERARWREVLQELQLRYSDAHANFVFFESKKPQAEIAAALAADGIDIGRAYPPLSNWTRISIGLPAENRLVQNALRRVLGAE